MVTFLKQGFVVLKLDDDETRTSIRDYIAKGHEFFDLSFEEKEKLESMEAFSERKANRGYLHVNTKEQDVKEYLKVHVSSLDWP